MSGRRKRSAADDPTTILPMPEAGNRKLHRGAKKRIAVTIINGMKPQTIGRALGIGVRIAGRVAGQHLAGPSAPAAGAVATGQAVATRQAQTAAAGQVAGRASRGVAKGVGGFLRPFGRVGGILWLEVTGVFFLLPVLVFAPRMWQTRASWEHGPDHRTFVASAIVVVVFLYLGITSFWRAHRRSAAQ